MPSSLPKNHLASLCWRKPISKILLLSILAITAGCDGKLNPLSNPFAKESKTLTPEEAFVIKVRLAEKGDAKAQDEVGIAYLDGKGIPRDLSKAISWLEKSAKQNNGDAQLTLALYYMGIYNYQDDFYNTSDEEAKKGFALLQELAEKGNKVAQYKLGLQYVSECDFAKTNTLKNRELAIEWLQKSADQGYAEAQRDLGEIYIGRHVPKEFKVDKLQGIAYLEKAISQGDLEAQNDLAYAYSFGDGVPKSQAKAAELFLKGAIAGKASAQSSTARNYLFGSGVSQDYVLAYAWANIASTDKFWGEYAVTDREYASKHLNSLDLAEAQRISTKWKKGEPLAREGGQPNEYGAKSNNSGNLKKVSAGTIFVINKNGDAITNHHVIQGCSEVRIAGRSGVAKVITSDSTNDLALVQIPGDISAVGTINSEPNKLRQGDEIFVFGYPLSSALSSGGNITPGVVSATTGLGNNTNRIQITAPIQPGSSGSPVLNIKGGVVGVVASKLSEMKMAKATGDISQAVNFAVNGQTLKNFLEVNQVKYSTEGFRLFSKSAADLAEDARKWTLLAECWQ